MAKVTKVITTSTTVVSELIEDIQTVMASVSDPANAALFPALTNPPPTTPDPNVPTYLQMQTAVTALQNAQIKWRRTRTKSDKTDRDNAKLVLVHPITGYVPLWAAYVQLMAGTDLGIMQKSSFNLSSQPQTIDELDQPQNLRVMVYNKGGFRLSVKMDARATGLQWSVVQCDPVTKQPVTGGIVKTPQSTASFTDVDGLTSGLWYAITCYAFASGDVVSTEANPIYVVCL